MISLNQRIFLNLKISILIRYLYLLLFFCVISHHSYSADLLFGFSVNDPNCVGNIRMNQLFAEPISYTKVIKNGGTALNPDFSFIENVWPSVITQATRATISSDDFETSVVYQQLLKLAKNEVALSTPTKKETDGILCYSDGPNKPCIKQATQMAWKHFSYYAYAAYLIKSYIKNQPDSKLIEDYLKNGFTKYIAPQIDPNSEGIFELADGYIGMYSYAKYIDDEKLAKDALKGGIVKIKKQLLKDGNINFSSFRGVRAYFYHSLAVDIILSFGELAEQNGIKFYSDSELVGRIRKSIEILIKFAPDPKAFEQKGNYVPKDGIKAFSTDEKEARRSLLSGTLALKVLIKQRFPDLISDEIRSSYFPDDINSVYEYVGNYGNYTDSRAGFVPRCIDFTPKK